MLCELGPADWPRVHALMVARDFPRVPDDYVTALPYLATCTLYGVEREVVFVVGEPDDGIAFLDVVCTAEAAGLWASRRVLRALARALFLDLALRCVWVQTPRARGLTAALKAGFVPVTPLDVQAPICVMTAFMARRRFQL